MSGQELQRMEVLSEVLARRRTEISAPAVLGLSTRHIRRLLAAYRDGGGGGAMINKAGGRTSNNQFIVDIREYAVELVRTRYSDFGPTLAAEPLLEKDGVKVSRETLRKWMIEDGVWLSRRQRRSFHQPRLRRENYGELIQIDGSDHRWFENRGAACSLLVFIDDPTGKLMQLRFVPSESTDSYFDCLRGYLDAHGCPVAFYSDIRSDRGKSGMALHGLHGLQELMSLAKTRPKPFDYLLCASIDRLGRDISNETEVLETFERNGVHVHIVSDDIDEVDSVRLFLAVRARLD
jgi:Resolvase, N terminal domain